jgi:AraC family transcriptional regulator of adaptative response/methylated-DNA-[protein]-cysteine methyltransferase
VPDGSGRARLGPMQRFATDDQRWQAVVTRDPAADGTFLYGVTTTGVYCRPSCPSRSPLRTNARFFTTEAAAEASGLRPCKRCRPGQAADANAELVERACRLIEEAADAPDLAGLAAAVGLSPHHFHRVFSAATGVTPKAYAEAQRARRLRGELDEGTSVTDALYRAGFGSSGRFYASSTARLGMTPGRFRQGGAGTEVRFALGQCSLGAILVAATDRGVCAIELGDDPEELVRSFQDRFHRAELLGGDEDFEDLVARVIALVERPDQPCDLPLDVQGTAFQERVWRALQDIPAGTTTTYTGLAAAIGSPSSVRAVAGACAANKLAIAIPCHRVVRTDGSLSGYRWGVERKRALIDREARSADEAARVG